MPVNAATVRRIARLSREADLLMGQYEEAAAQAIGRLATEVLDRIMVEIGTAQNVDELLNSLEALINAAQNNAAAILTGTAAGVFDVSLAVAVQSLEQFGTVSTRVLAALSKSFSNQYRAELLTAGHAEWYKALGDSPLRPATALREALIEAKAAGGSLRDAVNRMLELDQKLSRLPLVDQPIAIRARAARVVRTETGRVDNAVSVGFAEAAGVDEFVNLGVRDTRQSEECRIASGAPKMTIEKWRRFYSDGLYIGPAPRHPNCRCRMAGVPGKYEPSAELWNQAMGVG